MYVFEHCDIYNSRIDFGPVAGSVFTIRWQGACDVFFGEEYNDNLPFLIETEVCFAGVRTHGLSPGKAKNLLKQYIRDSEGLLIGSDGEGI